MTHDSDIPREACCLGCGYLLRGLPVPVCPECGRAFDPLDATTFGLVDPRRSSRRVMKWVGGGLSLLILYAALGPRSIMTSSVTLTCPDCGVVCRTARYELEPPAWISCRYPGVYWPLLEQTEHTRGPCPNHRYNVAIQLRSRVTNCGGVTSPKVGEFSFVNEYRATPEKAREIVESMVKKMGFSIGSKLVPVDSGEP